MSGYERSSPFRIAKYLAGRPVQLNASEQAELARMPADERTRLKRMYTLSAKEYEAYKHTFAANPDMYPILSYLLGRTPTPPPSFHQYSTEEKEKWLKQFGPTLATLNNPPSTLL
jgi:hypothetical protein